MENYIVITENDQSQWDDQTGVRYHYPSRYKGKIKQGSRIVYYKGGMKDPAFQSKRLSNDPHYFGTGIIGDVIRDGDTNNYFASILEFKLFNEAVPFKENGKYLELKANAFNGNYFRGNAVRDLTKEEFDIIISKATMLDQELYEPYAPYEDSHTSNVTEGRKVAFYTTKYERSKINRDKALKIHGYSCCICNINFKESYGEIGEGFIHIHHVKPLYELDSEVVIDPINDLVPVCPNCHAIIHRKKNNVLSIEEMKRLYKK